MATKGLKSSFMSNNQKSDKTKHADTVIRNHIIWSMGAGFIPVPIADIVAVSAVQLDMIRQLCRVYDMDFSETQGKAIVTSLTGPILARAGARSLIKLVPVLGTAVGGLTMSVFNGASTFALGEVFKKHFQLGGTILDFDAERLRKYYKEKFEKGKKVAEEIKKEQEEADKKTKKAKVSITPENIKATGKSKSAKASKKSAKNSGDIVDKLKELAELRDQGVISEEEFDEMKKKVITKFSS